MAAEPFDEERFPETISYGSSGGPDYAVVCVEMKAGHEQRIARTRQPRHSYNAAFGVHSFADLRAVLEFYNARQGCARGFRYKDWNDFTTEVDGTTTTLTVTHPLVATETAGVYQLVKEYGVLGLTKQRIITKPVAGTVTFTGGGTLDYTTGRITGSSGGTWKGEFDVPVRFAESLDSMFMINETTFGHGAVQQIMLEEVRIGVSAVATDTGGDWFIPPEVPTGDPPAPPEVNCLLDCPSSVLIQFIDLVNGPSAFYSLAQDPVTCTYIHDTYIIAEITPTFDMSGTNPIEWSAYFNVAADGGLPDLNITTAYVQDKGSGGCPAGTYPVQENVYLVVT